MGPRVLVIDNYDSFVYNLVQYLGELGADPVVHRHDALTIDEVEAIEPDAVLVSPGPGRPEDAGISNEVILRFAGRVPVLGVCLGHQCIGQVFGGEVVRAGAVMHGKTSQIHHDGKGVFENLPDPLEATRYHSLVVASTGLPAVLEVSASTADGVIMGVRHRQFDVEGVQFHPESILTVAGHDLLRNFLAQREGERPRRLRGALPTAAAGASGSLAFATAVAARPGHASHDSVRRPCRPSSRRGHTVPIGRT